VDSGTVFAFAMLAIAGAFPISWACSQPGVPGVVRWAVGSLLAVTVLVVGLRSQWVRQ
jgi:hypothetical protein